MAKNVNKDLQDSEKDIQKLQPDNTIINLPDVKDIPGQENIRVPQIREMNDVTISSDDEEGAGIFNEEDEDLSGERIGAATRKTEADLQQESNSGKQEEEIDEEDNNEADDDDDLDIDTDVTDDAGNVSEEEKEILEWDAINIDSADNEDLARSELDDTDFDGEKLNEDIETTGDDLDVPGAELDDADQEIGEEDEENNPFSQSDTE